MPITAAAALKGAKKGGDGLKVKTDVRYARNVDRKFIKSINL